MVATFTPTERPTSGAGGRPGPGASPEPQALLEDGGLVVVGFRGVDTCLDALRWGIAVSDADERVRLAVVHASAAPITVRNGPSAAVARAIGDPPWATVWSTVVAYGAPVGTTVLVVPGNPLEVLARTGRDADLVILGPRRRWRLRGLDTRSRLQRRLGVPVLRVHEDRPDPAVVGGFDSERGEADHGRIPA